MDWTENSDALNGDDLVREYDSGYTVTALWQYSLVWTGVEPRNDVYPFKTECFERYRLYCVAVAGGWVPVWTTARWAPPSLEKWMAVCIFSKNLNKINEFGRICGRETVGPLRAANPGVGRICGGEILGPLRVMHYKVPFVYRVN